MRRKIVQIRMSALIATIIFAVPEFATAQVQPAVGESVQDAAAFAANGNITIASDPGGAHCDLSQNGKVVATILNAPANVLLDRTNDTVVVCSLPGFQNASRNLGKRGVLHFPEGWVTVEMIDGKEFDGELALLTMQLIPRGQTAPTPSPTVQDSPRP